MRTMHQTQPESRSRQAELAGSYNRPIDRPIGLVGLVLLVGALVAGSVALVAAPVPFVEAVRLDQATWAKLRSDVTHYIYIDEPPTYKVIQQIEATAYQVKAWDPPVHHQDAIDQLRFKANQLGGDGIIQVVCDRRQGIDLAKNCWSSITCRGTAIQASAHESAVTL